MADFVAKVLLHSVIKIYFGCTRDFRVKMWGTSSPDDKLTDTSVTRLRARESAVVGGFFNSRKISSWRFGTFATISAHSCPRMALPHVRSWRKRTIGGGRGMPVMTQRHRAV